ncbi:CHAT domain-containing tetratricopeptide repeat protein [Dokdonia sp.]|uniref:CHAT domain-containing protein n=1 Tax=Dokdonia sp. TaxID=2024995 RepID=UPI00326656E4
MYRSAYYCILYAVVTLSFQVHSQEALKTEFDSYYNNASLSFEQKEDSIHLLLKNTDTLLNTYELGYVYHKLGLLYNRNKNYKKAIQETLKAIRIRNILKDINTKDLNNSLYNTYIYHKALGKIQKGKFFLEQVLKNKGTDRFNFKVLIELAILSMREGDYFKALQYLEPVILSSDIYKDQRILALGHLSCLEAYSKMSTPHKYVDNVYLHKEQIESLEDYILTKEVADMHTNLGTVFEKTNKKEDAIIHYNKALSLYIEAEDSNNIGTLYNNLGVIHSKKKEYEIAKTYYAKALEINESSIKKADVYYNLGFYLQTDDPKEKIKFYQKAIYTALDQTYNSSDNHQLPTIHSFKNFTYKPDVLEYLTNKANAWIEAYYQENNKDYLLYAKETLYLVDKLVSLIRLDSELDQSKLFWINSGVDSYMLAVEVCYLLQEPDEAFYFMEKNKALLLLENLDKRYKQQKLDIPDIILKQEKGLLEKRIALRRSLLEVKNNIELQKEFVKVDHEYTMFLDSIKGKFPAYYTKKNEPTILPLKESIEKHVSKDAYFIEYIINKGAGYGIFCTEDRKILFKIPKVPELLQQIQFLKQELSAPFTTKEAFQKYRSVSFSVYEKLFPFIEKANEIRFKKLTIVPDYELHNLPFSALAVSDVDTGFKLDYLLNYTETVYLHSASVFQQIHKTTRKNTTEIVGFAPTFFKNKQLIDLERSEEEMKSYTSFLPMSLYVREKASKKACLLSLKNTSIVHINSHAGYTKDNTPWLELYDDKITLNELYDIENNTELVILDACKSAQGTQEMGEGIMSLSRGFFYSGTQSVIASHWNVNEVATNEITHTFYKELKAGKTKSTALHTAKKRYLKTHQLEQTSPYFWASITLTGDDRPLKISNNSLLFKIGIGLVVAVLIVIIVYRKKFSII